jgi:hypothetical protein
MFIEQVTGYSPACSGVNVTVAGWAARTTKRCPRPRTTVSVPQPGSPTAVSVRRTGTPRRTSVTAGP